jgi:hypothetical protein
MTAPNIVDVAGIKGVTSIANFLKTSANTIVENPASSNNVIKLNSIVISNIDGAANSDATVIFSRSGTPYHICKTVEVPPLASLVVVAKETALYLEEGDSITAYASTNEDLSISASYEIISEQSITANSINLVNDTSLASLKGYAVTDDGSLGTTTLTFDVSGISISSGDIAFMITGVDTGAITMEGDGFTTIDTGGTGENNFYAGYKVLSGGETSIGATSASTATYCGLQYTTFTRDGTGGGMPTPPEINNTGDWIIVAGSLDDDPVTDTTAPSGYTLVANHDYGVSLDGGTVMMAYRADAPSGNNIPGAFGGSGDDAWGAVSIVASYT